jgi:hypothetical protein
MALTRNQKIGIAVGVLFVIAIIVVCIILFTGKSSSNDEWYVWGKNMYPYGHDVTKRSYTPSDNMSLQKAQDAARDKNMSMIMYKDDCQDKDCSFNMFDVNNLQTDEDKMNIHAGDGWNVYKYGDKASDITSCESAFADRVRGMDQETLRKILGFDAFQKTYQDASNYLAGIQ